MPDPDLYPTYRLKCALCDTVWAGDDLVSIARKVASHYNENHGSEMGTKYPVIDRITLDKWHIHKNQYGTEEREIRVTVYDVIDRLGDADGFCVIRDDDTACRRCLRLIEDTDAAEELEVDNAFVPEYRCPSCAREVRIERRREMNHSLASFSDP